MSILAQTDHSAWRDTRAMPTDAIPAIDLGPFLDGTDRLGVARRIGAACRGAGFLYLHNHGVPATLVAAVMAQAERFFALPEPQKMAVHIARSNCHRGYFPVFAENTDPTQHADLKEGFDLGPDLPPDDLPPDDLTPDAPASLRTRPLHGANQWPEALPGFRETVEAYYAAMIALADTLMEAMAMSLDLPAQYFRPMIDQPVAGLRLLHYPPQSAAPMPNAVGCGAHTDYGCLTILAQDAVGGLQVQNAAGDWVMAPPVPGAFIVNLGDQMARWTNDQFAATPHRVLNLSGRERYSIPFFFDPNDDAVIRCLDTCLKPGEAPKYPDVVAGDYLMSRLDATFSYRADAPA